MQRALPAPSKGKELAKPTFITLVTSSHFQYHISNFTTESSLLRRGWLEKLIIFA